MQLRRISICALAVLCVAPAFAQPLDGTAIGLQESLVQPLSASGLVPVNIEVPLVLAAGGDEDREPQTAVLADGSVIVYWVNRAGSHHFSGMKPDGSRIFPIFTDTNAPDVILGANTGANTNWTICEPSLDGTKFIIASTWKFGQFAGDAALPATVIDADGFREDDSQGHGFFKIFDSNLNEVSDGPVSVAQFSAGHRDWGAGGLSDGKWAVATKARGHRYAADPDGSVSSETMFINLFNTDGSRAADEFAPRYEGDQSGRTFVCPLSNGFAVPLRRSGVDVNEIIIYDNNGNETNSYPMEDTTILGTPDSSFFGSIEWAAGAGRDSFWIVYNTSGSDAMAALGMPAELVGIQVLLAAQYNSAGLMGYVLVTPMPTDIVGGFGRPRIAMAPNGSFVCSWVDEFSDEVTLQETMAFRVFNADGTPAMDAALAHDLPEFTDENGNPLGGEPGEPICAIGNDLVSVAWATRALGNQRDIAVNVVPNPASGSSAVNYWELF